MPLRKENPSQSARPPVKKNAIDPVISKIISKKGKRRNYPLYFMRSGMRERIDAERGRDGGVKPPSVNEWINEAILEKLRRDEWDRS